MEYPFPANALPKLGGVAYVDWTPTVAAWLYMDNSVGVCFVEWLIGNPEATPAQLNNGVKHLLKWLEEQAKSMDYSVMFTTIIEDRLSDIATRRHGFIECGRGACLMKAI